MSETLSQAVEQAAPPKAAGGEETTWQTPDYVVVETALEVTAYSLTTR
ncbi:pyrroloquinoline quinone precursor peptide PqqA [Streptomyces sp. URMC 123]